MANFKKYKLDVKKVGSKIKTLRKQNEFVQDDLAKFLGVTRSAYASIERGTYATRVEVLGKIIQFFSMNKIFVSIEDLIGLNEYIVQNRNKMAHTSGAGTRVKELEFEVLRLNELIKHQKQMCEVLEEKESQAQENLANALKSGVVKQE